MRGNDARVGSSEPHALFIMIFSFLPFGASCPLTVLNAKRGNPASHEKSRLRSMVASSPKFCTHPGLEIATQSTPTRLSGQLLRQLPQLPDVQSANPE